MVVLLLPADTQWAVAVLFTAMAQCRTTTLLPLLPLLQVEDRPIVRERVETIVQHRPVEKEFKTEVRSAVCDLASSPALYR
jgi:hypothetical protein